MKISIEILNILLLLLPGLVSSQIFYFIMNEGKEISTSKRIYDSIIFSFISYLIIAIFVPWSPILQVLETNGALNYTFNNSGWFIFFNLLIMALVPIVLAAILHNDYSHRILRFLKISSKTSRLNTWSDVLSSENRRIVIHLKDERKIRGLPTKFSTDYKEGYIYLFQPVWINDAPKNENDHYIETNAHGMLINNSEIDLIEFSLKKDEELDPEKRGK